MLRRLLRGLSLTASAVVEAPTPGQLAASQLLLA